MSSIESRKFKVHMPSREADSKTETSSTMTNLIRRAPRILYHSSPLQWVLPICIRMNRPVLSYSSRRLIASSSPDASEPPIDDSLLPRPIDRSHETPDVTRARLLYQSRKRGILETDLLLSTFAHKHLPTMSELEMREYDKVSLEKLRFKKADEYSY